MIRTTATVLLTVLAFAPAACVAPESRREGGFQPFTGLTSYPPGTVVDEAGVTGVELLFTREWLIENATRRDLADNLTVTRPAPTAVFEAVEPRNAALRLAADVDSPALQAAVGSSSEARNHVERCSTQHVFDDRKILKAVFESFHSDDDWDAIVELYERVLRARRPAIITEVLRYESGSALMTWDRDVRADLEPDLQPRLSDGAPVTAEFPTDNRLRLNYRNAAIPVGYRAVPLTPEALVWHFPALRDGK